MFDNVIYFLIGCPRTGSSFLYKLLKNNKKINLLPKENHFFLSPNIITKSNYFNTPKFFNNAPIKYYLNRLSEKKINYDINVWYFYDIKALELIKKYFPKSKFFCFLRNPVDRHYSHAITQIKKYFLYRDLGDFNFPIEDFYNLKKSIMFKNRFLSYSNYNYFKDDIKKNKITCKYFDYKKLFVNEKNYVNFLKQIKINNYDLSFYNKIHSQKEYPIKFDNKRFLNKVKFNLFKSYYNKKIENTILMFKKNYPYKKLRSIFKNKKKNLEKYLKI